MKNRILRIAALVFITASSALATAQAPVQTVDPHRNGNLAAAQEYILQSFNRISAAQEANNDHLGGHAQKAKDLLRQANDEITAAASVADGYPVNSSNAASAPPANASQSSQNMPPPPPPNISGNWTIFAENVSHPGSSLKEIQLNQNGNIISGIFHGPNQHGKLQGWINGTHVEFSTDTREVLTFRGEITATGMSGLYGVNGQHAPWTAQHTN